MWPDYEDLILQRQEAIELYEDGVDPDTINEMCPDIDFDLDVFDDFGDVETLGE